MIRSDDEVDDAEAEASMEGKPTMKSCWNTITNSVMGGGIRLRRTRAACEVVVATAELIFGQLRASLDLLPIQYSMACSGDPHTGLER